MKADQGKNSSQEFNRRKFIRTGAAGLAGLAALGLGGQAQASAGEHRGEGFGGLFAGKVVLITGATSGIGEAASREFAREGARVFFCGRRTERGEAVERDIRAGGGEATFMRADVRLEEEVKAFTDGCMQAYGRIDIAFNNAGIEGPRGGFEEISTGGTMGYDDLMQTNVNGVMYCMRHQIPYMREQGSGVIVNVGSMLSHRGSAAFGAYAASKHAVIGLTRSAAAANARHGIRVLSLSPGGTRTELLRRFVGGSLDNIGANSPMGRIAEPGEVARVMMSMCLAQNLFLNGDDIKADGASSA